MRSSKRTISVLLIFTQSGDSTAEALEPANNAMWKASIRKRILIYL